MSGSQVLDLYLPSKGLLYGGAIPDGLVKIRSLTTADEKILGDTRRVDEIIDTYLDRALDLPEGFSHLDLLTGDRLYAMYAIRAMSYGPLYEFKWRCNACGSESFGSVNIPDIPLKHLPRDAKEPFEIELPVSHDVVGLRLFRGKDENAVAATMRKRGKKGAQTSLKTEQLARTLVSVMSGEDIKEFDPDSPQDLAAARSYINKLIPWDSNELIAFSDDLDPGMDAEIEVECENRMCLRESLIMLPTTAEFFRSPRRGSTGRSARAV